MPWSREWLLNTLKTAQALPEYETYTLFVRDLVPLLEWARDVSDALLKGEAMTRDEMRMAIIRGRLVLTNYRLEFARGSEDLATVAVPIIRDLCLALRDLGASPHSLLLEAEFLTHRGGAKRLRDPRYLRGMAEEMADALGRFRSASVVAGRAP